MYCKNCGIEHTDGDCPNCGYSIKQDGDKRFIRGFLIGMGSAIGAFAIFCTVCIVGLNLRVKNVLPVDASVVSAVEFSQVNTNSENSALPSTTSVQKVLKQGDAIYNSINGIIGRYSNFLEIKEITDDTDPFIQVDVSVGEEQTDDFMKSCFSLFALYTEDAPMENYNSMMIFLNGDILIGLSNTSSGDPKGWTSILAARDDESQYNQIVKSAYAEHFKNTDILMSIS